MDSQATGAARVASANIVRSARVTRVSGVCTTGCALCRPAGVACRSYRQSSVLGCIVNRLVIHMLHASGLEG